MDSLDQLGQERNGRRYGGGKQSWHLCLQGQGGSHGLLICHSPPWGGSHVDPQLLHHPQGTPLTPLTLGPGMCWAPRQRCQFLQQDTAHFVMAAGGKNHHGLQSLSVGTGLMLQAPQCSSPFLPMTPVCTFLAVFPADFGISPEEQNPTDAV